MEGILFFISFLLVFYFVIAISYKLILFLGFLQKNTDVFNSKMQRRLKTASNESSFYLHMQLDIFAIGFRKIHNKYNV